MKLTKIIKAKLKGCGKEMYFEDNVNSNIHWPCGTSVQDKIDLCPKCKSFLSGMQTIIKESLEFLEMHRNTDNACLNLKNLKCTNEDIEKGYKASLECQIKIYDRRITDCKNALKLLEETK